MILERIRDAYEPDLLRNLPRGNPTGSQFGGCTAQLQWLITKAATPEPRQLRSLLTFEQGHSIEAWWSKAVRRAFADPYGWGLQQETFHLPVPVEPADAFRFQQMLIQGERWGRIVPDFKRPRITLRERVAADGTVQRRPFLQHLLPRDPMMPMKAPNWGFVLDPEANIIYAPTQIDFAIWHFDLARLAILETKSTNNRSFRRALTGELGYKERCQIAGQAYATDCDVTMLLYRKETSHLAEISYTKGVDRVHIELRKMSGQAEQAVRYMGMTSKRANTLLAADGVTVVPFPDDTEWDIAQVWTPWDDGKIIEDIQERIRLVLFARATDHASFKREWGPSFVCRECDGAGQLVCRYCNGTRKSNITTPKGKPCKACAQSEGLVGMRPCTKCKGVGSYEETSLPWNCSYAIDPTTPILTADYRWVKASELSPGDRLLGLDEFPRPGPGRPMRRMACGTVRHVQPRRAMTITLATEQGTVTCSPEHPWLTRRAIGVRRISWLEARKIRVGDYIAWVAAPRSWAETEEYMGGYIRGLVEGDGCIQGRSHVPTVRVAMADIEPLERLSWYLQYFGLHTTLEPFSSYANRPMSAVSFGGKHHDPTGITAFLLAWDLSSKDASAGYLAGMYDAEGSIEALGNIRIHQTLGGSVSAAIEAAVETLGLPLTRERWRKGRGIGAYRVTGCSVQGAVQFFTATRPALARKTDLTGRSSKGLIGRSTDLIGGQANRVLEVTLSPIESDLLDLTVDGTKTFIANGLVSHNCPVVLQGCYNAVARLDLTQKKPRYLVQREVWEQSGLTYQRPRLAGRG